MINLLLGLIAVILALTIVAQVAKINDISKILKGDEKNNEEARNTVMSRMLVFFFLFFLIFIYFTHVIFKTKLLPVAASEHGHWLDKMFDETGYLTGFVFIITQTLLFWFVYKYSGKKDKKAYFYPVNHKLELIWTLIPSLFLIYLVYMGMHNWYRITGDAPKDAMVVEVTGQQFNWLVRYPGADDKLGVRKFELLGTDSNKNVLGQDWSDPHGKDDFMVDEIHLPVNKPVLFKLGSKDVIHSFFLPHFRVQQNCVPGLPTQFHFKPTITTAEMKKKTGDPNYEYWLACAAICGASHYNMKMKIIVEDEKEFATWHNSQKSYYYTTINPKAAIKAKPTANDTTQQIKPAAKGSSTAMNHL